MHKLTFFPIGNANSTLIELDNGRTLLLDYAHYPAAETDEDPRFNLQTAMLEKFKGKDAGLDVVAFTHADDDHLHGFSELLYLEHAEKYQGGERIKIKELWVPAAIILETSLPEEAKLLRAEARYRIKEGKGIRIFSKPESLIDWLKEAGTSLAERQSFITSAGGIAPGFSKDQDGVEFFVHSPFSGACDGAEIERNNAALLLHATFTAGTEETRVMLGSDTECEVWDDIVKVTKYYKRAERLNWDVFGISHHCSYLALSPDKGKDKTSPTENVGWLFSQGNARGVLISSSDPITDADTDQPPHKQAAAFYKEVVKKISGEMVVTMEHPSTKSPEPIIITIDESKATLKKDPISAAGVIMGRRTPRAGSV